MNVAQFVLFFSSIILINPWGSLFFVTETGRAEVWTFPRVLVLLAIVIANFIWLLKLKFWKKAGIFSISRDGRLTILLVCFLLSAGISTLYSPFPIHSLLGHPVLGDGLLYWALITAFIISNILVLRIEPRFLKPQLFGILSGSCIVGLSIIPQVFDWRLDYTFTSGQVSYLDDRLLQSSIWQMQMPIGLYSNRGHASFVLASSICLAIAALSRQWVSGKLWKLGCFIMFIALIASQSLAGILSCVIGVTSLISWHSRHALIGFIYNKKRIILFVFTSLIAVLIMLCIRLFWAYPDLAKEIENKSYGVLENSLTGRLYLWVEGVKSIAQRPLFGWGYNGFGISHLFMGDWSGRLSNYIPNGSTVDTPIGIHEYTFDFLSVDGNVYSGTVFSHKAHNLIIDLLLSTGIAGSFFYLALLGYGTWVLINSEFSILASVVVVYFAFTQTWFESAQFSHLPWWCISLGFAFQAKRVHLEQKEHT